MAVRISDLTEDTTPGENDVLPLVDVGAGITKKVKAKTLVTAFMPTGMVIMWATNAAPSGWLLCDGSSIDRTTYAALFAIIGTTYGAVDGSHFTLPNLKGKVPVGRDSGQTEFDNLGDSGGEKTHILTEAELASHGHAVNDPWHVHGDSAAGGLSYVRNRAPGQGSIAYPGNGSNWDYGFPTVNINAAPTGIWLSNSGSNTAHNNLQPFVTINFVIKA